MNEYLLLIAAIAFALLALAFLTIIFLLCIKGQEDGGSETKKARITRLIVIIACGLGGALTCVMSSWLFLYLATNNIEVLENFALWYFVGFISRLLINVWRHDILSPIFASEPGVIPGMFFFALGGPITTLFLLKAIFWDEHPLDWLNK